MARTISQTNSQKVWVCLTTDDIKKLGFDTDKDTGKDVVTYVRKQLSLPEHASKTSAIREIAKELGITDEKVTMKSVLAMVQKLKSKKK